MVDPNVPMEVMRPVVPSHDLVEDLRKMNPRKRRKNRRIDRNEIN
jgi:hypothetical protein